MGRNQYWAGRVYNLCVYYMTGTPEGSTESGFMEKPGIEPATPGLQGIALINYTTGAFYAGPYRSLITGNKTRLRLGGHHTLLPIFKLDKIKKYVWFRLHSEKN